MNTYEGKCVHDNVPDDACDLATAALQPYRSSRGRGPTRRGRRGRGGRPAARRTVARCDRPGHRPGAAPAARGDALTYIHAARALAHDASPSAGRASASRGSRVGGAGRRRARQSVRPDVVAAGAGCFVPKTHTHTIACPSARASPRHCTVPQWRRRTRCSSTTSRATTSPNTPSSWAPLTTRSLTRRYDDLDPREPATAATSSATAPVECQQVITRADRRAPRVSRLLHCGAVLTQHIFKVQLNSTRTTE